MDYTAETRPWRTIFHIIYAYEFEGEICEWFVCLPGWSCNLAVRITPDNISPEIRDRIKVGNRYYGMACIGADRYEDLNIFINEVPSQYTNTQLDEDGLQ
jgi:hypothetical protein